MLDGMIQLLETIVAMEKMGDIAGGGDQDNVIDLHDILPKIEWNKDGTYDPRTLTPFEKDYEATVDAIKKMAKDNEDLANGLKNTRINGFSLEKIFNFSPKEMAE